MSRFRPRIDYTKIWIDDHYHDQYCVNCIIRLTKKKKFFYDSGIKWKNLGECYECGDTTKVAPLYKYIGSEKDDVG